MSARLLRLKLYLQQSSNNMLLYSNDLQHQPQTQLPLPPPTTTNTTNNRNPAGRPRAAQEVWV